MSVFPNTYLKKNYNKIHLITINYHLTTINNYFKFLLSHKNIYNGQPKTTIQNKMVKMF